MRGRTFVGEPHESSIISGELCPGECASPFRQRVTRTARRVHRPLAVRKKPATKHFRVEPGTFLRHVYPIRHTRPADPQSAAIGFHHTSSDQYFRSGRSKTPGSTNTFGFFLWKSTCFSILLSCPPWGVPIPRTHSRKTGRRPVGGATLWRPTLTGSQSHWGGLMARNRRLRSVQKRPTDRVFFTRPMISSMLWKRSIPAIPFCGVP